MFAGSHTEHWWRCSYQHLPVQHPLETYSDSGVDELSNNQTMSVRKALGVDVHI
jgi:hypothetical protein